MAKISSVKSAAPSRLKFLPLVDTRVIYCGKLPDVFSYIIIFFLLLIGPVPFCSAVDTRANSLPRQTNGPHSTDLQTSSLLKQATNVNTLANPTNVYSPVSVTQAPSPPLTQVLSFFWALVWASIGAFVSTMISYELFPYWRRKRLTKRLTVSGDQTHGNQARGRVCNGGFWTIKNAIIYLRLPLCKDDVLDPPPGHKAHIRPDHIVPIDEEQLCWSVRAPTINPVKIDIYAKERQPFSPCALTDPRDKIIIPSEEGWPQPVDKYHDTLTTPHMRVFLRPKNYTGVLKVVSEETDARYFRIEMINDTQKFEINIQPTSIAEWDAAKQSAISVEGFDEPQ
jgi:hypothetical protein